MPNTDLKRTAHPPLLPQGRRQVFKGGGLDPRYDKRGGGGGGGACVCVCVCAVHFRHNTKGGGLLSRRGGGTLHERDLLTIY